MNAPASTLSPFAAADAALAQLGADVGRAAAGDRLEALRGGAAKLSALARLGYLNPAAVQDAICETANRLNMGGEPGSQEEAAIWQIIDQIYGDPSEPPLPASLEDYGLSHDVEPLLDPAPELHTITPAAWKGTDPVEQGWLARGRIPLGDLTILSGNGGAGKSEIAVGLAVSVAGGLADWLGCVVENGPALFFSGEEEEANIRDRVERICKHRALDPDGLVDLHLLFPELDATWLCAVDRLGRMSRSLLLDQLEVWIANRKPRLVIVDSVAAVFDGNAIERRQVRAFLAMLRKIAREHGTAIVLLDHPSVRGMADGSGTANSVDWRNSVRSMLHLSDPDKDDADGRTLEVKKSNRGRPGEKTELRWNGLTFTTAETASVSLQRVAAEREVDELFLRLLDKRNAQRRPVHAKAAKGSAPSEFEVDPDAGGVKAEGFRAAMERLLTARRIVVIETGSSSKRRSHLERATQ